MIMQEKLINLEIKQLTRIKFNMLHRIDTQHQQSYNIPHPDETDNDFTYTMVYYVNDSDGDTVLFNEFYDKLDNNKKLTIHQRVKPKKNRALIFNSKRYHASSNPVDNINRTVLNFIMVGKQR
jgi:hypothetical protein